MPARTSRSRSASASTAPATRCASTSASPVSRPPSLPPASRQGADIPYNQSINTGLSNAYYCVDAVVPQPRLASSGAPGRPIPWSSAPASACSPTWPRLSWCRNLFNNAPYPLRRFRQQRRRKWVPPAISTARHSGAQNQFNTFKTGFFNGATLAQLETAVPGGFGPSATYSIPQHFSSTPVCRVEFRNRAAHRPEECSWWLPTRAITDTTCWCRMASPMPPRSVRPTSPACPRRSPIPASWRVTELTNQGISNYDGVTFQYPPGLRARLPGPDQLHLEPRLDDVSNGGSGLQIGYNTELFNTLANPNIKANYGNSDYDVRHNVTGDFV